MNTIDQHSHEMKFHKNAISWRRSIILQKLSEGYNQNEIARELQLHPSTISLDCQWIRERSKQNIETFVSEKLPEEVEKAFASYNAIIKKGWDTANNTEDDKTRLQALNLVKETFTTKLDLVTNVDIIKQVLNMSTDKRLKEEGEDKEENTNTDTDTDLESQYDNTIEVTEESKDDVS